MRKLRTAVLAANLVWCAIVIAMALAKIFEVNLMVHELRDWGLRPFMISLGLIELGAVLLYLYPPTMRVGFFLLCSFFGGAVATTLQHGASFWPPALMLGALWVLAFLRAPLLFRNVEVRNDEWDYLRPKPPA